MRIAVVQFKAFDCGSFREHFQHLKELGPITEFQDIDWMAMVDHVEVCTKNRILFTFKDGSVVNAAEEEG